MKEEIMTTSAEETQRLGERLAHTVQPGDCLFLSGELGSGKTTFVQGFAKGLGITRRIISPTFTIVRQYEIQESKEIKRLYHLDLYRINSQDDLQSIAIDDILKDSESIIVIEWPEKLGKREGRKTYTITFSYEDDGARRIIIERNSYE